METGLSFSIFGKKTCAMGGQAADPDERHFAQCAEHGIRRVELVIMEGYLNPGDRKALTQVRRWAESYGVNVDSVHGPSGWPTNGHWLGDPDESARRRNVEERRLAMEGAQSLGARYMVVEFEAYPHWPYWPHGQKPQMIFPHALDQWRRSLDELLETAARAGARLAIENIDGISSQTLAAIMAELDPKLAGVCFDSSHATYGGNFDGELEALAPYIIGTHLSDNDALPGGQWADRHWKPFSGVIDWASVVAAIGKHSPCPCLTLEVLDRENPCISPALMDSYRRIAALASGNKAGMARSNNETA